MKALFLPILLMLIQNHESHPIIRELEEKDIHQLCLTFCFPWTTFQATSEKWKINFFQQQKKIRTVYLLEKETQILGYGSLLRFSEYLPFRNSNIPEINDVWISDDKRRQGLGKFLIEHIEKMARQEGYRQLGIGVGLYHDYGPAQILYSKLRYLPDGNGVTYKEKPVVPGESYPMDDELIFWLIKSFD